MASKPKRTSSEHASSESAPDNLLWPLRLLTLLLAATFAAEIAKLFSPFHPGDWLEAALLLLATAVTLVGLCRQLPLQNVLLATVIIAALGSGAHLLSLQIGAPFGPFLFGPAAGPQWFHILPWSIPLLWVVIVLNSRGMARLILRPWRKTKRYGFWLIGLTAALVLAFDFAFDPFAAHLKHYWLWETTKMPLTWQGAPLVNFLSWGVLSIFILALITPSLINKQPGHRGRLDFYPFGIWLGALIFFGAAAVTEQLWAVVIADAIIGVIVTIFSISGARW